MLKFFRVASLVEGCSYLVILCVTLGLISRDFVVTLGMLHGGLFIVYVLLSLVVAYKQGWSVTVWLLLFVSALIPLAFIPVELFLQKELKKRQQHPAVTLR